MNFKGAARRLEAMDIGRIASTIRCGEDHLRAVIEVETRGGGFDVHGRPKMLFEPHVFYRELSGAEREEAVRLGLAYRRWGERRYPRDSYPRLIQAMGINVDAALRSASWGLGQIMGFNHQMAGYLSAKEMVDGFLDDEEVHLAAMVEFIISCGLDDDLRREDWRGFARGYNGSGYAKHGYHTKLKASFGKWQKIPDAEIQIDRRAPDPNPPEDPVRTTRGRPLRIGMKGPDVKILQQLLAALGYHSGAIDGDFGRATKSSTAAFQSDHDLVADGIVGELTWAALDTAKPKPRRDVSEQSLRDAGSGTIEDTYKADLIAKGGLGTLLGGMGIDTIPAAIETIKTAETTLNGFQRVLVENWMVFFGGVIVVGLFVGLPLLNKRIRWRRVEDAATGRNMGR